MSDTGVSVVLATAEHRADGAALAVALGFLPGFGLVAHVSCAEDVLSICRASVPNVLVLDDALTGSFGWLGTLERLADLGIPTVVVLLLAGELSSVMLARAVALGACGFVTWGAGPESIRDAVRAVADGQQLLLSRVLWPVPAIGGEGEGGGERALSRRELEVLALSSSGRRTKQIAGHLGIAEETVETLLTRAARKLGARTRTHAVAVAVRRGLV